MLACLTMLCRSPLAAEPSASGAGRLRFTLPSNCTRDDGLYAGFGGSLREHNRASVLEGDAPELVAALSVEGKPFISLREEGAHVAHRTGHGAIRRRDTVLEVTREDSGGVMRLVPEALQGVTDAAARLSMGRTLSKYRLGTGRGFQLDHGVIDRSPDGWESVIGRFQCGGLSIEVSSDSRFAKDPDDGATPRRAGPLDGAQWSRNEPLEGSTIQVAERAWLYVSPRPSPSRPHLFIQVSSSSESGPGFSAEVDSVFDALLSSLTVTR
jgi:hypothetical protein